MSEADVTDHTGPRSDFFTPAVPVTVTSIVYQPTRGANIIDRIFVSSPCYRNVRVVKAVVSSDHKAIVAHQESVPRSAPKTMVRKSSRKRMPAQNALFLQHLATMDADISETTNDCQ